MPCYLLCSELERTQLLRLLPFCGTVRHSDLKWNISRLGLGVCKRGLLHKLTSLFVHNRGKWTLLGYNLSTSEIYVGVRGNAHRALKFIISTCTQMQSINIYSLLLFTTVHCKVHAALFMHWVTQHESACKCMAGLCSQNMRI